MKCIFCRKKLPYYDNFYGECYTCNADFLYNQDKSIWQVTFSGSEKKIQVCVDVEIHKTMIFLNGQHILSMGNLHWLFPKSVFTWAEKYLKFKVFL